jgi:hypothetical protein
LPFSHRISHLRDQPVLVSVALAPENYYSPVRRSGLSTPTGGCFPRFPRAPLLYAARTFLWPGWASDRSAHYHPNRDQLMLIPGRWCRRGDSNSHGRKAHYALNVARLPVPPLRRSAVERLKERLLLVSAAKNIVALLPPSGNEKRRCFTRRSAYVRSPHRPVSHPRFAKRLPVNASLDVYCHALRGRRG